MSDGWWYVLWTWRQWAFGVGLDFEEWPMVYLCFYLGPFVLGLRLRAA